VPEPVRAAGGVIRRGREFALVHRPRYDDWTLPKGKVERGETDEDCAVREVREETGLRCRVGREIGKTRYEDGAGRPKVVRFFELTVVDGKFAPSDEVDELRWVSPDEAHELLSYEGERHMLRRA